MLDYEIVNDEWEPRVGDKVRILIDRNKTSFFRKKIGYISYIYGENSSTLNRKSIEVCTAKISRICSYYASFKEHELEFIERK